VARAEEPNLAIHVPERASAPISDTGDSLSANSPIDLGTVASPSSSHSAQDNRPRAEIMTGPGELDLADHVAEPKSPALSQVDDTEGSELAQLREKCGKFRVLVLGRANAGKTTLLKAVCGTTNEPEVWDGGSTKGIRSSNPTEKAGSDRGGSWDEQASLLSPTAERGIHSIETQLVFPSNQGFIFHDSQGFEAGSDEELQEVMRFIKSRAGGKELKKQLHAIWYCIPTDNEARMLSGPEQELLTNCSAGPVPLVVIFTKFDSLEASAFRKLRGGSKDRLVWEDARKKAPGHAKEAFQENCLPQLFGTECPKHICLRSMHKQKNTSEIQEKIAELIQKTKDAIDVDTLKLLLVSVQKNNLQLSIEYAVKYGGMEKIAAAIHATGNALTPAQLGRLINNLLEWFAFIVYAENNLEHEPRKEKKRLGKTVGPKRKGGWFNGDKKEVCKNFHSEIAPRLVSLVGTLPVHLHVPTLAIDILIVVARLFWHTHGKRPKLEAIQECMGLYVLRRTSTGDEGNTSFKSAPSCHAQRW